MKRDSPTNQKFVDLTDGKTKREFFNLPQDKEVPKIDFCWESARLLFRNAWFDKYGLRVINHSFEKINEVKLIKRSLLKESGSLSPSWKVNGTNSSRCYFHHLPGKTFPLQDKE